jgi:hypothetical protein
MTDDLFHTYRKVFASAADESVTCWYLGTLSAAVDGFPEIPVLRVATIMVYRAETVSPTSCRIHWNEIGEFIDHTTGEPTQSWLNPITGERLKTFPSFKEGPACYTVAAANGGLAIGLGQPGAKIDSVTVERKIMGDRVWINQVERKTRSLHGPGKQVAHSATTVLSFFAALKDVADPKQSWAPASGSYSFTMNGLMPWMGMGERTGKTVVRGVVHKARTDEPTNPGAWQRLAKLYPTFFADLGLNR